MARDTSPQCKQCRREGQKLFLKGERCLTDKCGVERRSYPPGEHGRGRIKQSEYLLQLREKQKARRYYGLLEKQFRAYYEKADRKEGVKGEVLLRLLEPGKPLCRGRLCHAPKLGGPGRLPGNRPVVFSLNPLAHRVRPPVLQYPLNPEGVQRFPSS